GPEAGSQATASANPAAYNGCKVCPGQEAPHGDQIQELRRRVESGRVRSGAGATESRPVVAPYQDYLGQTLGSLTRPVSVVVDAGNGTAGPVAPLIYRRLGARVRELFCDMDGRFPNHHPDPTVSDN